jgi:hypothetical protein
MTSRFAIFAVLLSLSACDLDVEAPDPVASESETAAEECEVGYEGCDCYGGDFCSAGLGCVEAVCVPCSVGGEGCDCYGDSTCEAGLYCEPASLFCRAVE